MPQSGWILFVSAAPLALMGCEQSSSRQPPPIVTEAKPEKPRTPAVPVLDVGLSYPTTEAVGGTKRIHLDHTSAQEAHSPPEAWKLSFDKGGGFGGICWKNRAGNDGDAPGDDLSKAGYRRIAFWAKGKAGGEVVEFRAGGLGHVKTRYMDSFDVTAGKLKLTPEWKEYIIYVSDANLASVMTPFCALFYEEDNPNGASIWLDDIQYRG
jgi:hypothetical protein